MHARKPILGIHPDLQSRAVILFIAGVLVAAMGGLVFSAIVFPSVGALFGGVDSSIKLLFFLVSAFFFWLGYISCIATPLRYRRITRAVLSTPPKLVRFELREEQNGDSTDFLIDLHVDTSATRYFANRPAWVTAALLNKPLEGWAHFHSEEKLAAVKLEQGFIWVVY